MRGLGGGAGEYLAPLLFFGTMGSNLLRQMRERCYMSSCAFRANAVGAKVECCGVLYE